MRPIVDIEDRRTLVRNVLKLFPSSRDELAESLGRDIAALIAWNDPEDVPTIVELQLLRDQLVRP